MEKKIRLAYLALFAILVMDLSQYDIASGEDVGTQPLASLVTQGSSKYTTPLAHRTTRRTTRSRSLCISRDGRVRAITSHYSCQSTETEINGRNMGITGPQGPQGVQGPTGATGATGAAGPAWKGTYGSFYNTTTQVNAALNSAQAMTLNSISAADGISVVDLSKVTFSVSGVYNLQFSAQVQSSDPHVDTIDIWLAKNGMNIPYSNNQLVIPPLGGNSRTVAAWNFMFDAAAGDYVELMWSSPDVGLSLSSVSTQSGPPRPNIPSLTVTVQQVR